MSRGRAIAYAFCAPLLFFAVQFAVTMTAGMIYVAPKLDFSAGYQDQLYESVTLMQEMALAYSGHMAIVSCALVIVIFMLAYRKRSPGLWEAVRLTGGADAGSIALAALAGASLGIGTNAMLNGLPISEDMLAAYEEYSSQLLSGNIVIVIIAAVLVIPFTEELVFRGFTHRYLARILKPWQAVTMQAVIFAMFHGNTLQALFVLPSAFLMGAAYLWTRSLRASIAVHMAYNLSGFLFEGAFTAIMGESGEKPSDWLFAGLTAVGLTLAIYFAQCIKKRAAALALAAETPPERDSEA